MCCQETRLWSGLEARLVACASEAFSTWATRAKLVLPSLADVAQVSELRKTRRPKKKRRAAESQDVD